MTITRTGFRRSFKKNHATPCQCDHEHITHYTKDGHCAVLGCDCLVFKSKGRTPFQNKRAHCQFGHSHDSGLEIKVCFDLYCEKTAGTIKDYSFHKVLDLTGPSGAVIATYEIDFIVQHIDGTEEFIETKGDHLVRDMGFRLKWALLTDKFKGDHNVKFRIIRG